MFNNRNKHSDGVKPLKLTVTQEEGSPTLIIRADTLEFGSKGGEAAPIFLMSNSLWTLKCSEAWIAAKPETGGNFSQVTVSARENIDSSERKGEVLFSVQGLPPKIIVVTQKAAESKKDE